MKAILIGCGRMGCSPSHTVLASAPKCWFPLSHLESLLAHSGINVVGLCDTDKDKLLEVREAYRLFDTRISTSVEETIRLSKADLICLATRTSGRASLIKSAYQAGVRYFHVEKPLCNSVSEYLELTEILKNEDVFVTWGAIRRFMPPYKIARQLLEDGVIGSALGCRIEMGQGSLFWTHPHSMDLILYFSSYGELLYSQAKLGEKSYSQVRTIQNDPTVKSAIFGFENGYIGSIDCTPGCNVSVFGEKGLISVNADGSHVNLELLSDSGYLQQERIDQFDYSSYQGTFLAIDQLVSCRNGDPQAIISNRRVKADILKAQEMLFACVLSDERNGGRVSPNELDFDLRVDGITEGKGT